MAVVAVGGRKQLAIPPDLALAFCYESRRHSAASFVSPGALERAAEVLLGLLRRGITSVPFGIVLDWTLLIDREWDFPSRTLEHASVSDTATTTAQMVAPLPVEYENECLNPYLLSPHLRRVRDIIVLRGRSVPRLVHLFEQIFEGIELHLPFTVSFYELFPNRLPGFFETADLAVKTTDAGESGELSRLSPVAQFRAEFGDAVPMLHEAVADFLRRRLSADPVVDMADPAAVHPYRPTDVDLYELEHVEIFTSRVARLRCRRFGEIGQVLGPPETRGLNRLIDIPEVVVNRDDETQYPAGGVAELTTRGSFENLLPSELMYLEDDPEAVDIFSLKYVENELLFFVRDAGLLVRRRRRLNVAVWDVPGFRIKYPHQGHSLEVYLDGLLVRLFRDLFDFFEGEGLRLTAHWVFPGGISDRAFGGEFVHRSTPSSTPTTADDDDGLGGPAPLVASAGAKPVATPSVSAQGPQDLFDLLFHTERDKGLASFQAHDSPESLANYLRDNDHPLNQWVVVMAPSQNPTSPALSGKGKSKAKAALAGMVPTWSAMARRSGKPATLINWRTDSPAKPARPIDLPVISLPSEIFCVDSGEDDGCRELQFSFPAHSADPIPALRSLRQFLLNTLITFV